MTIFNRPRRLWLGLLLGLVACTGDQLTWSRLEHPPTRTEVQSAGLLIGPSNGPVERVLILHYSSRGCRKCQRLLGDQLGGWQQEVQGGRMSLRVILALDGKAQGGLFCLATRGKVWTGLEELRQGKMPPECALGAAQRRADEGLLAKTAPAAPGMALLVYSGKSLREAWKLR